MADIAPRSTTLADVSPTNWTEDGSVTIARLISRASDGSELVTGALRAEPKARFSWTQDDGVFETYYVLRGKLKVNWSRDDTADGQAEVGPDGCVFFAPGWSYSVEVLGDEQVFAVYSITPASA